MSFDEAMQGLERQFDAPAYGTLPTEPGLYQANIKVPAPWGRLEWRVQGYLLLHPEEGWWLFDHGKITRFKPENIDACTIRSSDWSQDPAVEGFTIVT